MTVDKATILCRLIQTHAPMVFLDYGGTRPLPSAEFLSMFQIVITTTQRFMNEAKKGSFQQELDCQNDIDKPSFYNFDNQEQTISKEACEMLKVHWLRMVIDEGHSMGNDKNNSTIQFASWVKARRRWVMTGTPTKHNAAQLGQMRGLMRFLQHDFFTSRLDGDTFWKTRIVKGWKDGEMASFFRLHYLLRFLMRRHTKMNIIEIPPPIFSKSVIETSYVEANTYNTLVSAVQMNLLLTSMNGKTSGFQDSLLHRSQAKNARLAVQNIRRVCTGWSRVVPTLNFRFYAETVDMARSFNHSEEVISEIKQFMSRAEQEELSVCLCCGIQLNTMLLMSCCGGLSTSVYLYAWFPRLCF
jgi:SNF2 family DNA or RNA helicase